MIPGQECSCCGRKLPDVTFDMGTVPRLWLRWLGADAVEVHMDGQSVYVTVEMLEAFLRNVRQHKGMEPW